MSCALPIQQTITGMCVGRSEVDASAIEVDIRPFQILRLRLYAYPAPLRQCKYKPHLGVWEIFIDSLRILTAHQVLLLGTLRGRGNLFEIKGLLSTIWCAYA